MALTKSLLLLLGCYLPAAADNLKGDWVPPALARQLGSYFSYGHKLTGGYYLVLGDADRVTNTSIAALFRLGADHHYHLLREQIVEGDWDGSQFLQYFPLPNGGFALGRPGRDLSVLIFARGLRQDADYYSFYAGPGASPWTVPSYQLNLRYRRLVVELVFDSPDGPSEVGKPEFEWTGAGFRRL